MKLGVFGGSFDPIHYGHLILAEQCREQIGLDRVLFVPASVSPLKTSGPVASNKHRLAMAQLAIAGHDGFEVSAIEIERGGSSYTVETLKQLKTEQPDAELFLLMGQDSLDSFSQWREPAEILQLARPVVVRRPRAGDVGGDASDAVNLDSLRPLMDAEALQAAQDHAVASRLIDISSTDIRQRVSAGQSIRYLLPRSVEKYIQTNKLYIDSN